jgi:hypothetical protein
MLGGLFSRRFSDFAHKQVSSGFSKKYGENFERIFRSKKPGSNQGNSQASEVAKDAGEKTKSK